MYGGGGNGASLADIAALMRNNGDGFGGGGGWWILVLLWAMGGNGWFGNRDNQNNGNCGGGSGGGSVTYQVGADMQRGFDTNAIIQKLDGLNSGLCSLGYDQLAQMGGIRETIQQTGFNLQQAIAQLATNGMMNTNQLIQLIQSCCCGTEKQISDLKYTGAMQNKDLITAINQVGQNIMQNDNNNYRQLHDEIFQLRYQDLKDQNAQLMSEKQILGLQVSQDAQTTKIVEMIMNQLRNCPVGTYNVCNPQTGTSPIQQILNLLGNNSCCQNSGGTSF